MEEDSALGISLRKGTVTWVNVKFMVGGAPGRDGQHVLSLVVKECKEEKDHVLIRLLKMEEETVLVIGLRERTVTWVNVK